MLGRLDYQTTVTKTVDSAWEALSTDLRFDGIYLDNLLGDEYGWLLLQKVRQSLILRELPVIVYTHRGDRASILRYIELGVQNILMKPYDLAKVEAETARATAVEWRRSIILPTEDFCRQMGVEPGIYLQILKETSTKLRDMGQAMQRSVQSRESRSFELRLDDLRTEANSLGIAILHRALDALCRAYENDGLKATVPALAYLPQISRLMWLEYEQGESEGEGSNGSLTPVQGHEEDEEAAAYQAPVNGHAAASASQAAQPQATGTPSGKVPPWLVRIRQQHPQKYAARAPLSQFAADFKSLKEVQVIPLNTLVYEAENYTGSNLLVEFSKSLKQLDKFGARSLESLSKDAKAIDLSPERIKQVLRESGESISHDPVLAQMMDALTPTRMGLLFTVMRWLAMARERSNPLCLERMALDHIATAVVAREIGDALYAERAEEMPIEKAAVLRPIGLWIQALLYPGLFALAQSLTALDPDHAESWELRLLSAAQQEIGLKFLQSVEMDQTLQQITQHQSNLQRIPRGPARTLGCVIELADIVSRSVLSKGGDQTANVMPRFLKSPAWELLKEAGVKVPYEPREWFPVLMGSAQISLQPIARFLMQGLPRND